MSKLFLRGSEVKFSEKTLLANGALGRLDVGTTRLLFMTEKWRERGFLARENLGPLSVPIN